MPNEPPQGDEGGEDMRKVMLWGLAVVLLWPCSAWAQATATPTPTITTTPTITQTPTSTPPSAACSYSALRLSDTLAGAATVTWGQTSITGTAVAPLVAAPGTGLRTYVGQVILSAASATVVTLSAGSDTVLRADFAAAGTQHYSFPADRPLCMAANTKLAVTQTGGGVLWVSVAYITGP